jgi:maltoporin
MKRFIIAYCLFNLLAAPAFALNAEFSGYLRGGTGLNLEGGHKECFTDRGIPGNFLRLGNECSFYSELAAVFTNKHPSEGDANYFKTQVRLMFENKGTRQWEDSTKRDINQIEAFVMAGGFSEMPGDYWVGKRFYRDVDLHIFDWYYYADMSGVGAGVENIPMSTGKLSVAHLIQANETLTTSVGKPVLQALDLRWKTIPVGDQNLNLWGVYAWAPESKTATDNYVATNGYVLAARVQGPLGNGNNNFSVLYGKGAMKDLNIYGSNSVNATDDSQNRAWTARVVEDWHHDVSDKWAVMAAFAAEMADNGATTKSKREWQAFGIRPIYAVSDRFQWVFETGYSRVKNDSEVDGSGNAIGERNLGRVTIAPQLTLGKSIWSRPVLRAYLAHSFWTTSNKTFVATNAPTFADKTAGTSIGYQFEAWF